MAELRSRWQYALTACGWLGVFLAAATVGSYAEEDWGLPLISGLAIVVGGVSLGLAFVYLGRAMLRGQLRRSMWRDLPAPLRQEAEVARRERARRRELRRAGMPHDEGE